MGAGMAEPPCTCPLLTLPGEPSPPDAAACNKEACTARQQGSSAVLLMHSP